jgi:hypothetical protein
MPIARFQMPDGRIARFEVPDGTTPEQAQAMIEPIAAQMASGNADNSDSASKFKEGFANIAPNTAEHLKAMSDQSDAVNQAKVKNPIIENNMVGAGEGLTNMVSGLASSAVGGYAGAIRGLYGKLTGEDSDTATRNAADVVRQIQEAGTYQPRTESGKLASQVLATPLEVGRDITTPAGRGYGMAVEALRNGGIDGADLKNGQSVIAGEALGKVAPDVIAALYGGKAAIKATRPGLGTTGALEETTPKLDQNINYDVPAIVRRAAAEKAAQAAEQASPQAVPEAPVGTTDTANAPSEPALNAEDTVAARHAKAQSLPIPMELTRGMALDDSNLFSREQNAKYIPEMGQRLQLLDDQLVKNASAIKEQAAPDLNITDTMLDHSQGIIDSIKSFDQARQADITSKYKALADANGGDLPVNGDRFVKAADAALHADDMGSFLPTEVKQLMNKYRDTGDMTFNQFETMRTILARAQRATMDGNASHAIGVVREALETLPLSEEASALKPLADAARQAARERFQDIKIDPAYKAITRDATPVGEVSSLADNFTRNYIINGKTANVGRLMEKISDDPVAKQKVAAAVLDHLRDAAGIDLAKDTGNFAQSRYNAALEKLIQNKKLEKVLPEQQVNQVKTLGEVARYVKQQKSSAFVNNSNTAAALAGKMGANAIEHAINAKTLIGGTVVRKILGNRALEKEVARSLEPNAGAIPDPKAVKRAALALEVAKMQERARNATTVTSRPVPVPRAPIILPSQPEPQRHIKPINISGIINSPSVDEAIRQAMAITGTRA